METMTEEQFEAYAKRIADAIVSHDTAGNGYQAKFYSKHNGIIYWRLAHGSRSQATQIINKVLEQQFVTNPLDRLPAEDHEAFVEHVIAHVMGGGFEPEWDSE